MNISTPMEMEASSERLLLSERMPVAGKYPWLTHYHGKGFRDQTFSTKSSTDSFKSEHRSIPELRNNRVVSCSHGWLLLSDNDNIRRYSIWNPITSESIDLPLLRFVEDEQLIMNCCLLSSSPLDPNCLILLFASKHLLIIYCRPGDEQWAVFSYEERANNKDVLCQAVSCAGKICARSDSGFLHLINVDKFNNVHSLSLLDERRPKWYHPHSNCVRNFLVESGEQLLSICICVDDFDANEETLVIEVSKFDFSTTAWEKVTQGNGGALFLGSQYSVSCPIPPDSYMEEDQAGCYIYFTKDETLYSYRIEDESIVTYLPSPDLPKPLRLPPVWILPADDHHRVDTGNHRQKIIRTSRKSEEKAQQQLRGKMEADEKETNAKSLMESRSEEPKQTELLCDLPSEILALIAGKLSFVDCINFRCVNRLCSSTIPMRTANTHSPCLIFLERSKGLYSFVDSKRSAKYSLTIPETLKDHTIRYSKEGWLLMDKQNFVAAFNPITKETIQYPDVPSTGCAISSFIFTSSPSSSDSLAIGMSYMGSQLCVQIKDPEDYEWCFVELDNHHPRFKPCSNAPLFYQGSFYYIGKDGRLGVVQLENDGRVDWKVIDKPREPCSKKKKKPQKRIFLVECNGDLLSVFLYCKGKESWIRIFKLNPPTEGGWSEISTLESYSLYVSRSSSFAAIAERPDLADRVYLPRFYQDGLVYYSLKTKRFHSLGSEDSLQNLYRTRMPLGCAWIPPTALGVTRTEQFI